MVGSKIMGPRVGLSMPGHNAALATLGTFILWVGWLGFNGGSALVINGGGAIAACACVNTVGL
jgi:Amt family ammonium transporter